MRMSAKQLVGVFALCLSTASVYADDASKQIQMLNSQLQVQLQRIQETQQEQIQKLNKQLQDQLKDVQTKLQDQIQQVNKTTQDKMKEMQEKLQAEIKQVHEDMLTGGALAKPEDQSAEQKPRKESSPEQSDSHKS